MAFWSLPSECEYGDRVFECDLTVGPHGRFCYDSTIRIDCCDACNFFYTHIPGCMYGDRKEGCQPSKCNSPQQLYECCLTCLDGGNTSDTTWPGTITQDVSTTSSTASPTVSSTATQTVPQASTRPDWVVPVVASAAGIIVILVIILVVGFCLRRRRKKLEASNDKMNEENKVSKRAPMAPPRPDHTLDKRFQLQRQDTEIYDFINPKDMLPDSEPPLPECPKEFVYLSHPDEYGYMEASAKPTTDKPDTHTELQDRAPGPYTHLAPTVHKEIRRQNSYGEFPHAQEHNKASIAIVSERL